MKKVAKWIAILWSIFCLIGVVVGMYGVGKSLDSVKHDAYSQAGASIGMGCGLGMWVGIWLAVAGPAMFIYLLAGNKKEKTVDVSVKNVRLCSDCGKYYEGDAAFCPNCGRPIQVKS